MKKFIFAAVAASLLATPVMAAPHQGQDNRGRVEQRGDHRATPQRPAAHRPVTQRPVAYRPVAQRQVQQHRWNKGERFDRNRASNYRVIASPRHYRLRDAPRGYRWVQSGNDAVLIGITSGIVASVLANMIR